MEQRYWIQLTVVRTGHQVGEPDQPNLMTSPQTPFFWVVNSMPMKKTAWRSMRGQVEVLRHLFPIRGAHCRCRRVLPLIGCLGILTWVKEKEEAQDEHVCEGHRRW